MLVMFTQSLGVVSGNLGGDYVMSRPLNVSDDCMYPMFNNSHIYQTLNDIKRYGIDRPRFNFFYLSSNLKNECFQ
jgi:hypothetical protein